MNDPAPAEVDWRQRLSRSLPRMIIGGVIGVIALVLALRGVSWPELRAALARTNPVWLLGGFACVLASLTAYITRWWLLFTPDHRARSWTTLAAATIVGQAVNIAIPARLGELARTWWVGSRDGISKVRIFATIVVEKAVELTVFTATVFVLLISTTLPAWLSKAGAALIVGSAIVVPIIVSLAFSHERLLRFVEHASKWFPERWGARPLRFAQSALLSLQFMRNWRMAVAVWTLSVVVTVLSATTNYLLLKATGIDVPYVAAVLLLVVLRVGEAPPSLPGKLGVFHYLVVLALSIFGVDRTHALTYAFVLYAVAVVPVVIAGALLLTMFRAPVARQPAS